MARLWVCQHAHRHLFRVEHQTAAGLPITKPTVGDRQSSMVVTMVVRARGRGEVGSVATQNGTVRFRPPPPNPLMTASSRGRFSFVLTVQKRLARSSAIYSDERCRYPDIHPPGSRLQLDNACGFRRAQYVP